MHWIYIVIASFLEICWIYSLKYIDIKKIKAIQWGEFFSDPAPVLTLLPVVGYVVFGVSNVIFLSMAMNTKILPASTVFGVWMGLALVGALLVDLIYFEEPINFMQMIFTGLIIVGVIGLKAISES